MNYDNTGQNQGREFSKTDSLSEWGAMNAYMEIYEFLRFFSETFWLENTIFKIKQQQSTAANPWLIYFVQQRIIL